MRPKRISRRKFMVNTGLSATGIMMASQWEGFAKQKLSEKEFDLMEEVRKFRKIDAYATSSFSEENLRTQLDFADRLEIEKLFIAHPMTPIKASPQEFRELNNRTVQATKKHPKRLIGEFTINPIYKQESLEEIDRCLEMGMRGTRLYNQVKINDPLYFPIIEKLSDLNVLIFMHGECQLGVGGYRMKYDAKKLPTTSTPADFADAARRYPEAMFQFAHIGGGGDWECMCKTFEDFPNIYVDTGGSNNEEYMIDFALKTLGEDRLFFGTDNSFYQSVGKILSSNLNDSQKRKIFSENYLRVLKKGGYDAG